MALRPLIGIPVIFRPGVLAQLFGLVEKILDGTITVMLSDNLADAISQLELLTQFNAPLHMRTKHKRAHGRGKLVVWIGAAKLVFHKIIGALQLSDIVVQRPYLAQQTVRSHGGRPGLHKVGNDKGMMIRARHIHHKFLKQGLLQVHKLHEAKTGGIAQHCFQNGTERKEQ